MLNLFFSTKGRIGRAQFLVGVVVASVVIFGFNRLLHWIGETTNHSMLSFWLALVFPFLALYVIYCLYGKRLTDIGRSRGWVFAMFALETLAVIIVMLSFGGADYFDAFSKFDRKDAIDPAVTQAIIDQYQSQIAANIYIIKPLLMAVPAAFTAWLGLAKPRSE